MSQVKKISVATVYGKINLKELIEKGSIDLMDVIGSAVGSKTGDSQYGPYTSLSGMFQACNCETGEISDASILFLPDVALIPIMVSLSRPECKGVEFAIRISVKYVESKKPGGAPYEYTWTPLLPPAEDDPITRIKNRMLALTNESSEAASEALTKAEAKPATKSKK